MGDNFDDIDIPDNWLESNSKRRLEDTDYYANKRLKSNHTDIFNSDTLSEEDDVSAVEKSVASDSDSRCENLDCLSAKATDIEDNESDKDEDPANVIDTHAYREQTEDDVSAAEKSVASDSDSRCENLDCFSANAAEIEDNRSDKDEDPANVTDGHAYSEQTSASDNVTSPKSCSSHGFDAYGEWSLNEPEFNAISPIGYSPEQSSEVYQTTAEESQVENCMSFNSNGTFEDLAANQPEPQTSANLDSNRDENQENSTLEDQSLNLPEPQGNLDSSLDNKSLTERLGKAGEVDTSDHNSSLSSAEGNVGSYVEDLSFTDDELRFLSSEPGNVINLVHENVPENKASASTTVRQQEAPVQAVQDEKTDLRKISSLVRDAKIISGIVPDRDFNEIYDTLLDHRDNSNRLDIVTVQLLEKPQSSPGQANVVDDIFEEVQIVMSAVPHAEANAVYTMLEGLPPSAQRVRQVIAQLSPAAFPEVPLHRAIPSSTKPTLVKKESSIDDPVLRNDPLFRDMRTISKMFPETDRNEIYALLEANHDKSSRLQTVIGELGQLGQDESQTEPSSSAVPTEDTHKDFALSEEDIFEQDIEVMKNIFPDCDPNFLYEKLEGMKKLPNRTDMLASELFEKKDYPKIKDIAEKAKAREKETEELARKERVRKLDLTVEEFLERFPEPEKTFGDESTQKSTLYQEHAYVALRNEFRMLKAGYLKVTLLKHKSHFYPTYREISSEVLKIPLDQRHKFMNRFMKHARSYKVPMPTEADEYFYHEYWFIQNEENVKEHPKQKEEEKKAKIEEAKARGELFECGCCYDDECLFEDLTSCPEGHLFCKTCVVRSTEAAFGEMKTKFPCLTGECEQNIPLSTLQAVISANLFSKIVRRMQEEEILQANIKDLVSCPFCPFATIMPNPDDKIFKCLNPECLKESCRLCQEPNHIPLRCNEVEKKAETNMRTFIENRISEAVMRKCEKCGKRFVKEVGCNMMTCICGATSCYACKKQRITYDHFSSNKACADTDPNLIHTRDMKEATLKAKQEYLELHPEAADIELKTGTEEMIKNYVSSASDIKNIPMIGPGGYLGRQYGGDW